MSTHPKTIVGRLEWMADQHPPHILTEGIVNAYRDAAKKVAIISRSLTNAMHVEATRATDPAVRDAWREAAQMVADELGGQS